MALLGPPKPSMFRLPPVGQPAADADGGNGNGHVATPPLVLNGALSLLVASSALDAFKRGERSALRERARRLRMRVESSLGVAR